MKFGGPGKTKKLQFKIKWPGKTKKGKSKKQGLLMLNSRMMNSQKLIGKSIIKQN